MKRHMLVAVALVIGACALNAQDRGFGLGVIVGEPTGISAKGWVSPRGAIDAGFAWSFRRSGFFHAHMDYLWHFRDIAETSQRVIPYLGVGGRVGGTKGSAVAGVRIPVGITWWPEDTPIDVFLEIAPIVDFAPATEFSANGGLGIRFFFR